MKIKLTFLLLLGSLALRGAETQPAVNTLAVADRVLAKGLTVTNLGTYPGTVLLQGMSELALLKADPALLARTTDLFLRIAVKDGTRRGNFISYEAGGSGSALLLERGFGAALAPQVRDAAERMFTRQRRSPEGLLIAYQPTLRSDQLFIDEAFAVSPFMLYAGLTEHRSDYVDLAAFETLELYRILRDKENGLVHQGRGFATMGVLSEDDWSRGNGWGAMALAALVRDLPANHPQRAAVEVLAKDFFLAVLRQQDRDGLWHQEMTDHSSYAETSGSALLLYGLGIMIEKGLLGEEYQASVAKGIAGLTAYIAADGSVSHTSGPCRCPGQGTKDDFKRLLWVYNDPHAFGATVLAFTQAAKIGIHEVTPVQPPGCLADPADRPGTPMAYVRYDPQGAQNISWENERMAYRIYGPPARNKVGSGIDVWAKSVEYPIVDKWYRLNAAGLPYHIERGEGCDFYEVGHSRGCGGLAIWRHDRPYVSQTYATHRVIRNDPDEIEFTVEFEPWEADGIQVSEQKTIRLVRGTNFFQVVSILHAPGAGELTVGLGLSTFGHAALIKDASKGILSSWDQADPAHGMLGTAVLVDPAQVVGFSQAGSDHYILLKIKPDQPFCYYLGAGWSGNSRFAGAHRWQDYVMSESGWEPLNRLYANRVSAIEAKP